MGIHVHMCCYGVYMCVAMVYTSETGVDKGNAL